MYMTDYRIGVGDGPVLASSLNQLLQIPGALFPPLTVVHWFHPGSMPTNYELYYGFTRFAIELNELDPVLKDLLPPTDARFRPDQR